MTELVGDIDREYGIKIVHHKAGYLTSFVLNIKDKKYVVFFHDKIIISYGKTKINGEIRSVQKITKMLDQKDLLSLESRILDKILQTIEIENFIKTNKSEAASKTPYFVAEEIQDYTNNITYMHDVP